MSKTRELIVSTFPCVVSVSLNCCCVVGSSADGTGCSCRRSWLFLGEPLFTHDASALPCRSALSAGYLFPQFPCTWYLFWDAGSWEYCASSCDVSVTRAKGRPAERSNGPSPGWIVYRCRSGLQVSRSLVDPTLPLLILTCLIIYLEGYNLDNNETDINYTNELREFIWHLTSYTRRWKMRVIVGVLYVREKCL